jgi:cellulose synthase (UDP-forming)
MSFDLTSLRGLFLVGAFWLLVVPLLSRRRNRHRQAVTGFTALLGLIYLAWRLFRTVLPFQGPGLDQAWIWLVYLVEMLAFLEVCLFLLLMSRTGNRRAEADRHERLLAESPGLPSVDVLIPTYNEGMDVLERTIFGAKHLDYPNAKVWVLDDGRRPWLGEFCAKVGVGYLVRPDNAHAKAGNLNHGLAQTSGELFAIFDADFVPARNFLRRTVGFFLAEKDIGIVQTPQHFFNRDPVQSNLYLEKVWPDEQRLFFDAMAPCRDAWNAAFCCGSCSIMRREAVMRAGGIPTSSITEDLLTTLCLLRHGYRTVYLDEKLSQGMAADSVRGYFIQRARWCRGGIQCLFVPEGPLRARGLSLIQRILFAPYGWIVQPFTRMLLLVVPATYLWLGLQPLAFTSTGELIMFQFPMLLGFALAMQWLAPRKYIPLLSTAVGVFGMFRLLPVVVASLLKPFGEPFRVTPKGAASTTGVDWYVLALVGTAIGITVSGILVNLIPEYRILTTMEFFPYALFWGVVNLVILAICALICFDMPRRRREERFMVGEPIVVAGVEAMIEDLSLGGCKLGHAAGRRIAERGGRIALAIPDVPGELELEVRNANPTHLMGEFVDLNLAQREALVAKLFTGRYDNEIHQATGFATVLAHLLRRAFGRERR